MWRWLGNWLVDVWRWLTGRYVAPDAKEEDRQIRLAGQTSLAVSVPGNYPPFRPLPPDEPQSFPAITDDMLKEYIVRREATKPPPSAEPVLRFALRTTYEPAPETIAEKRKKPMPESKPTEFRPDDLVMAQWFPQIWFYAAKIIGAREDKYYIEFLHKGEKAYVKRRQMVRVDLQIGDFVGVWFDEQARYGFVKDVNRQEQEYLVDFQDDDRVQPPKLEPTWVKLRFLFVDLWDLPPRFQVDTKS